MYPLLLRPVLKDYLWGGTKLKNEYSFDCARAAEAWMLCCHKDGTNVVQNGAHKGKTLDAVLSLWGKAALGGRAEDFTFFPLLIKLIDAEQKLSIQVHPDDEYALRVEGEYGKTEMWYVLDCKEGAELIYGFRENISKETFEKSIKDNTLPDICNRVKVKKGDTFFITAGTLHAIGEGILIAEVQQNSNTTYRVSDYGRLGADGKPRELHVEKALAVTKRTPPDLAHQNVGTPIANQETLLACCDKFTSSLLRVDSKASCGKTDSFVSLVLLEGSAKLHYGEEYLFLSKGDSVFLPAGLLSTVEGDATILYSHV